MATMYRLVLEEIDDDYEPVHVLADTEDTGYFIARELKRLAKRVDEPAPVIPVEGQQEIQL